MIKSKMIIMLFFCCFCCRNLSAELQETTDVNKFDPAGCFDKVWTIINNKFWDPNFNGVDWNGAKEHYRPIALAAHDHESFGVVVNQMLAELKTSHTYYYTKWDPSYYTLQAVLISGDILDLENTTDTSEVEDSVREFYSSRTNFHRTGIGVVTKEFDGRYFVSAVLTPSPAKDAGIFLGDWIVQVNGEPFHPIRSFENRQGQELEVVIQRSSSETSRRKLSVTAIIEEEREIFEKDSVEHIKKLLEYGGHRFSYVRLWWLSGLKMRSVFETAISYYNESEGIIIDIRDGFGGSPSVEYIHPFLKSGLETITQESITRRRKGNTKIVYDKPVIVLINGGSRSGKELLAYYFKKTKRALLIGERTAGYVCGGSYERISDDSLLLYAASMLNIDGKRLEGIGVAPDIEIPFDIRFANGRDVQLERAKDEMIKLIEANKK